MTVTRKSFAYPSLYCALACILGAVGATTSCCGPTPAPALRNFHVGALSMDKEGDHAEARMRWPGDSLMHLVLVLPDDAAQSIDALTGRIRIIAELEGGTDAEVSIGLFNAFETNWYSPERSFAVKLPPEFTSGPPVHGLTTIRVVVEKAGNAGRVQVYVDWVGETIRY